MSHPQSHAPHAAAHVLDETDPHGFAAGHSHGHTIIPSITLRTVLLALLVMTVMTVGAAQLEHYVQIALDIKLPHWVNICVALSIAVVKSALVLMYFMQLKYDNPINTIVFLFTLFAMALFLGFSMLDLGSRATVYQYKSGEVQKGGMGNMARSTGVVDEAGNVIKESIVGPIVQYARERKLNALIAQMGAEAGRNEFARLEAEAHAHNRNFQHAPHGPGLSDANRTVVRSGLTADLFSTTAPAAGAGEGHGEHH